MKRTILTAVSLLVSTGVMAQVVTSIVFTRNTSTTIGSTVELGADLGLGTTSGSATNWNNVPASTADDNTPLSGFLDESGNAVSSDFSITFDTSGKRDNGNSSAEGILALNGVRLDADYTAGDQFITLSDTDALFGGQSFDLLVYAGRAGSTDATNATFNMFVRLDDDASSEQSISSVAGTALIPNSATDFIEGTNFVRLRNISASSGDIFLDVYGTNTTGDSTLGTVGAIQLVVVPEPSTYAILVGLVALAAVCSRRRLRK